MWIYFGVKGKEGGKFEVGSNYRRSVARFGEGHAFGERVWVERN